MTNVIKFNPRADATSGHVAARLLSQPAVHSHLVQFYVDDDFLFEAVGHFLAAGLQAGDRLIVFATGPHREGFVRYLRDFDIDGALASGQLMFLDARDTLATFMVDGQPDPVRFKEVLSRILNEATDGCPEGARIRAYGEMVDLLWRDGARLAAMRLEELWNEASKVQSFSLLCAYVMANFYKESDAAHFFEVCRAHSHVIPAESFARLESSDERLREISRLQQLAGTLGAEIEHRKELEHALRESLAQRVNASEERFRLLVENVRDYAIFMLDPKGIVTTWNSGAERIKGYLRHEIVGKHFSTFYPAEDRVGGLCERELEDAARDGRFEAEGWRLRKDGSRFWANVVITALRDDGGELFGFAKVTRDLTDRIRADEERLRLARAEEAERRKDEFLAIMGHELRNPLAPMVTAVHLIKLRGGRDCSKAIDVLDRQLGQLTRLVEDLLDASRALRDKVHLAPKLMEISDVLAGAVEVASPAIEGKHHRLRVDVPTTGLLVDVDPERMTQIFGNLLNNAAKFTDDGGEIRLRAAAKNDTLEVIVEDTGAGIAPEFLPRVFELFAQGGQQIERQHGGLGIGLAIAKRLVKEHRGEIVAESDGLGKGSRFTVRLPRVVGAQPTEAAEQELETPRLAARRRVLIVDDNEDSIEMMREVLVQLGHEVFVAHDGPQAIEVAQASAPDIILLDVGLPGLSGYEVARRMRQIQACAKVPIIAVTGYAREIDRAQALSAGFSDHVAKPIDIWCLESLVGGGDEASRDA
jgi:PAS domain S-box-containing protein